MSAPLPVTADFRTYPTHHRIREVTAGPDALTAIWDDGHVSDFHHLWLRDNCACTDCIHPVTREQVFEIVTVPDQLTPVEFAVTDDGGLRVAWSDGGHASAYHPGWLRAHCYSATARAARATARPQPELWGSELAARLPTFAGPAALTDDRTLLDWLVALRDVGVTLLREVPGTLDVVGELAERVGFARHTNFGTLFDVHAQLDGNSNAYTALELPLHTDLPTRELEPGVQILHCLANDARGGDSLLVDGFRLAACLAEEEPALFEALTTIPVDFNNTDWETDYRWRSPIIRLDAEGTPVEIRFGTFLRGPFDLPADQMAQFYQAYRRFSALTRDPRFLVRLRLEPGDLMAFDNRRVLHARTAFEPSTGRRHLRGCYLDRDEVLSRIRVLQRQFPPTDPTGLMR